MSKQPDEKKAVDLTPFQLGYQAGSTFNPQHRNPYKPGFDEASKWERGYQNAIRKVNERALAFLSMGTGIIQLHQVSETGWGYLMAALIQQSGNAMATIYLGAELTHRGLIIKFMTDPAIEPRHLLEIASIAAMGKELPKHFYGHKGFMQAYDFAKTISNYITSGDDKSVQIDSAGLMKRIIWGDNPPPEAPLIIPAKNIPAGMPPHTNSN